MQPPDRYSVSPLLSFCTVRRFTPPPARSFYNQFIDIVTMLGLVRSTRTALRQQAVERLVLDALSEEFEGEAEADAITAPAGIAPAGKSTAKGEPTPPDWS
jgi:hypothetical protein